MEYNKKKLLLTPFSWLITFFPESTTRCLYFLKRRKKLNLKNPETYSDKVNWLKLNYKDPQLPYCADKLRVREYVEKMNCGELLPQLYWEGDNPEDIPFSNLPDKFVIKVSHGSGFNIICKDKSKLNKDEVKEQLSKWLKDKYLKAYGEWYYTQLRPKILIEEFLSDNGNVPDDYKVYCFNNLKDVVGLIAHHTDRGTSKYTKNLYDKNWEFLEGVTFNIKSDPNKIKEKPELLEEMIDYAKVLSKPFPHVRVDFYIVNNKLYLGELTFTTGAGFSKVEPQSFDKKMGDWINLESLPQKNCK